MNPDLRDKSPTMFRSSLHILMLASSLLMAGTKNAPAQAFWDNTFLLDAYMGSHRSNVANALSNGGYELSGGAFIDFHDWYTSKFPDMTVLFLKQVAPDFGIIWGLSTGEKGEKYKIDPALQLGLVYQYIPFENTILSITAVYPLFGQMTEETCVADYGSLGGIQTVNCRMAADTIPPEETLDYLIRIRAETDAKISVNLSFAF